jgi:hypothetical protein
MLMTYMYDRPFPESKNFEMRQFQKTLPGQIGSLIGASLPRIVTGVLGPAAPIAFGIQQMELAYGRSFDERMARSKQSHPGWTNEQRTAEAGATANEAAKVPGIIAFALGIVVIVIAWLTRPRLKEKVAISE